MNINYNLGFEDDGFEEFNFFDKIRHDVIALSASTEYVEEANILLRLFSVINDAQAEKEKLEGYIGDLERRVRRLETVNTLLKAEMTASE